MWTQPAALLVLTILSQVFMGNSDTSPAAECYGVYMCSGAEAHDTAPDSADAGQDKQPAAASGTSVVRMFQIGGTGGTLDYGPEEFTRATQHAEREAAEHYSSKEGGVEAFQERARAKLSASHAPGAQTLL